jgi:hypothetical protein
MILPRRGKWPQGFPPERSGLQPPQSPAKAPPEGKHRIQVNAVRIKATTAMSRVRKRRLMPHVTQVLRQPRSI